MQKDFFDSIDPSRTSTFLTNTRVTDALSRIKDQLRFQSVR